MAHVITTKIRLKHLLMALAVAFVVISLMVIGSFGITMKRDALHGLRIGDMKADVIKILIANDVFSVEPDFLFHVVINRGNIEDISELMGHAGVCVTDNKGASLHVSFVGDERVIKEYSSVGFDYDYSDAISSKQEFFAWLRVAIMNNRNVVATNCVVKQSRVELRDSSQLYALDEFPVWRYNVPGGYSTVSLLFDEERLKEIDYHWRPFETP